MRHLDKVLHFETCFIVCIGLSLLHPVIGVLVAATTGFTKELYDSYGTGNGWCWYDIAADALGIIAALLIMRAWGW